MKTLVTGATGLVGSHIVEKLCREGDQVFALVRQQSDTRFLEGLGVELRYGSITDPLAVYAAVEGWTGSFCAAAHGGMGPAQAVLRGQRGRHGEYAGGLFEPQR